MARRRRPKKRKVILSATVSTEVEVEEVPDLIDDPEELDVNDEDDLLGAWSTGVTLKDAPRCFALAGYTYSQQLEEEEHAKTEVV